MQPKLKSQLYKKLLIGSILIFILGVITSIAGLLNLYRSVDNSGFSNAKVSSPSIHTGIPKVASIVAAIGFYAALLFLILFLVARHKEK
jgi:UPF0716 family protein affecting phage T7 exclusion